MEQISKAISRNSGSNRQHRTHDIVRIVLELTGTGLFFTGLIAATTIISILGGE